jgi:hypothetical protein
MSGRAIERTHHVGRRTIIKALDSPDPPARKKIHREPTALNGLRHHINAMIGADPQIATATIWQRLADEHGTIVAYYTLRTTSLAAAPPPGTASQARPDHARGQYPWQGDQAIPGRDADDARGRPPA